MRQLNDVCRERLTSIRSSSLPFSRSARLFSALLLFPAKGTPAYISLIKSKAADHTHPILSAAFSLCAAPTFPSLSFLPATGTICAPFPLFLYLSIDAEGHTTLAARLNARPALLSHAGHLEITVDTVAILGQRFILGQNLPHFLLYRSFALFLTMFISTTLFLSIGVRDTDDRWVKNVGVICDWIVFS